MLNRNKNLVINILLENNDDLLRRMCDFWYGYHVDENTYKDNRLEVDGVISKMRTINNYDIIFNDGRLNFRSLKAIPHKNIA